MSVRENLVNYKNKVSKDLVQVDNAISDGIYPSKEEWVDFICKSAMVGYRSLNILKYRLFNRRVVKFSECMAEVISFMIDIACNGFDNESFLAEMAYVVSKMNTLVAYDKQMYIDAYDKNGSFYVSIRVGSAKEEVHKVSGVKDAIDRVEKIFRCCINNIDSFSHNGDFGIFLERYIGREFSVIVKGELPSPYVCEGSRCTLKENIRNTSTYQMKNVRTVSTSYTRGKLIKIS